MTCERAIITASSLAAPDHSLQTKGGSDAVRHRIQANLDGEARSPRGKAATARHKNAQCQSTHFRCLAVTSECYSEVVRKDHTLFFQAEQKHLPSLPSPPPEIIIIKKKMTVLCQKSLGEAEMWLEMKPRSQD